MLDFGNDKKKDQEPVFTLDKRAHARRRGMQRREWRTLLTLPLALVAVGVIVHMFSQMQRWVGVLRDAEIPEERRLDPMPMPTLQGAIALPTAAQVEGERDRARQLSADPRGASLWIGDLDALTVAWGEMRLQFDRESPPIPQRLYARDLLLKEVRSGAPVVVSGQLVDSLPSPLPGSDRLYQRMIIALDEGQFAQVLAPAEATGLVIGNPVQVVGRLVGHAPLPQAEPKPGVADPVLPLLMARAVIPLKEGPEVADTMAEFRGPPLPIDDDLFKDLDDERTFVETRPYYRMLGQARLDMSSPGVYDKALSLNKLANEVHQDPGSYRGKPFTVTGYIYSVQEDVQVAKDQPFGVERATRLLVWARNLGSITETIDGKTSTSIKEVLRLFEVVVIGQVPKLERGDQITAEGRFLKFRAIPVKKDRLRDRANDVQRQSDRVYPYLVVSRGLVLIPPPPKYEFTPWSVGLLLLVLGFVVLFWRMARKDAQQQKHVHEAMRRIRENRRRIQARPAAVGGGTAAPPADDPAEEPPPPAAG